MKLSISNFLSINEAEFQLGEVTFLFGDHGSGKTTVASALDWLLRGVCRGIRTKKECAAVVVADGAKAATVCLETPSMRVTRKVTSKGTETLACEVSDLKDGTDDWRLVSGTPAELQESMLHSMGTTPPVVSVLLSMGGFLALDEDGRRKLLQDVVAAKPTEERILGLLADAGVQGSMAEEVARAYALGGAKRARDSAIESRRSANRRLEGLATKPPSPTYQEGEWSIDLASMSIEQLRGNMDKLHEQSQSMASSSGESRGRAQAEVDRLRGQIKDGRSNLQVDFESTDDRLCALSKAKGIAASCVKGRSEIEAGMEALRGELNAVPEPTGAVVGQPDDDPPHCPLFERPCIASKARLASTRRSAIKSVEHESLRIDQTMQKLQGEIAQLDEKLGPFGIQIDAQNAEIERLEVEIAEIEDAVRVSDELRASITEAEGHLVEAEGALASASEDKGGDRTALMERIARGARVVERKAAFDERLSVMARMKVKRERLTEDVERATQLDDLMRNDQIPAKLASEIIGPMNEVLSATCEKLLGGGVSIALTEDLRLTIAEAGTVRHEVAMSHSQMLRVGWAVQVAISVATGFRFLFIDEVSTLSDTVRGAMASAVIDVVRERDPEIRILFSVASQRSQKFAAPPEIKDFSRVYVVGNGTVSPPAS